jgi:lantibiotic modifying enzyme
MGVPLPFVEALAPRLKEAEKQLTESTPGLHQVLTTPALAALLGGLAYELALLTSPLLLDRFLRYPGRRWYTPYSSVAYTQFVTELAAGGFQRLLEELPQLAMLLDQVVGDWVCRAGRLIARIERDAPLLRVQFGVQLPFDSAKVITDSATELEATGGARLVYKDRPLGMDAAFGRLLRHINGLSPSRDLFAPRMIDGGDYGWMAYVPQRAAQTPADREAYFTRVGMLLCLVHALGGGDIHAGNVRAFREHPVIIDGEVLLRPRRAGTEGNQASVLATGWLPTVMEVERCGLAAEPYAERTGRWVNVGTDAIRRRPLRSPLAQTRPEVVDFFQRDQEQLVQWLCAGFREMYTLVQARGLPLDLFAESEPRVLLRTSFLYQETIERSLSAAALTLATARAAVVEQLVEEVPPAVQAFPTVAAAVAAAERTSMLELQVPRFTTPADGRQLLWREKLLGDPFKQSPLQRARKFITAMSAATMEGHCRDIAGAVAAAGRPPKTGGYLW